jgi:CRISPR-associated endonuclease Cas1
VGKHQEERTFPMQTNFKSNSSFTPIPIENGLCVLSGYGIKVNVSGNRLHCQDGIGVSRRESYFHRATSGLKRLVLLSKDGYISLEAFQWLQDIKASILLIGNDGKVIFSYANPGSDYPQIRRSQAIALFSPIGLEITRELIKTKIQKQAEVIDKITNGQNDLIAFIPMIDNCKNAEEIQAVEATAAARYWKLWSGVPITYVKKDINRIPEHWLTFGERRSPVSNDTRKAANPGNALLNYAYAILEGETALAALTLGLDPGLGLMHTDQPSTKGLVYDLMEVGRPEVDFWLYRFLQKTVFTYHDFWETERGETRLSLELRKTLTKNASEFSALMGTWVEFVAQRLSSKPAPTLLTQSNRSKGRDKYRKNTITRVSRSINVSSRCVSCGKPIEKGRVYCDDCLPEEKQEQLTRFSASGPKRLQEMRDSGIDPAHGGELGKKRGNRNRKHILENKKWDKQNMNNLDDIHFEKDILPGLQDMPIRKIQKATGLSLRYCSLIRQGKVPHKRHWENLLKLVLVKNEK